MPLPLPFCKAYAKRDSAVVNAKEVMTKQRTVETILRVRKYKEEYGIFLKNVGVNVSTFPLRFLKKKT